MHTQDGGHIALNAHLLSAQAGYRSAGINGYIFNLLNALPEADPSFTYTVFTGQQAQPPEHKRMTTRRAAWATGRPTHRILWEQAIQPAALRQVQPDLLHALAFVSPVVSRIPTVVTVYDLSFVHYPEVLPAARRLYLRLLTRYSCRRARRVIAISHSTARDIAHTFGIQQDRIDIAAPGVGPQFRPLSAEQVTTFRLQNGLPDRFLLFVGTLEPRKNLAMLLQAYAALPAADRAAVHLVLAGGKGWMFEDIFQTVEAYNLRDTVHIPGYIPAEALPLWYNAADVFVYPSLFEGFGLPVVEAMACGTPVLVSNVSSLPEAAGNSGYCLPPDNDSAWTDALYTAIHDPDWRRQAGQSGLEHAARFTWENTAIQTVASYRRALHQT
jgi:glycosyltransferase involved in cell wall biosynthesis